MKRRERKHDHQELFCIGGTMADIYPGSDWSFVYGLASVDDDIATTGACTDEERILILKQAINTFVHEVIRLFGVEYCIYYLCLMNGSETEEAMDGKPLYLCPVYLRKMFSTLGKQKKHFNVIQIYTIILDVCKRLHFKDELAWYENRLNLLNKLVDD